MPDRKIGSMLMLVFRAIVVALLFQGASMQVTAQTQAVFPGSPPAPIQPPAPTPTPKPRPPTRREVAQLKAQMAWPGSTLTFVAIVGNFAEAGFTKGGVGGC